MAISDRIAIMNAGRIVQIGTAEELYRRPGSAFVATFLGEANLIKCRIVEVADGPADLGFGDSRWTISSAARGSLGAEVEAVVRPEAIKLSATGHGTSGTGRLGDLSGIEDRLCRACRRSEFARRAVRSRRRIAFRRGGRGRRDAAASRCADPGRNRSMRLAGSSHREPHFPVNLIARRATQAMGPALEVWFAENSGTARR